MRILLGNILILIHFYAISFKVFSGWENYLFDETLFPLSCLFFFHNCQELMQFCHTTYDAGPIEAMGLGFHKWLWLFVLRPCLRIGRQLDLLLWQSRLR